MDDLWEQIHKAREWGTCPEPCMARFLVRRFGAVADRHAVRVLDVGCATGANTRWAVEAGFDAQGIDGSGSAINRAVAWPTSDLMVFPILYRCGDATALPYKSNTFDAVVDVCCLQHVEDITTALSEVRMVLKAGGWLFSMSATSAHSAEAFGGAPYRAMTPEQLQETYRPQDWAEHTIESQVRSDRGLIVAHWLIELRKPE